MTDRNGTATATAELLRSWKEHPPTMKEFVDYVHTRSSVVIDPGYRCLMFRGIDQQLCSTITTLFDDHYRFNGEDALRYWQSKYTMHPKPGSEIEFEPLPEDPDAWKPRLTIMSDIEAKPVTWLWQDRIAAGRLSLLVGMPGIGKSYLTADMAARVSTGQSWPDGSPCPVGSVLFLTAEDDPADTIRPRLDAHGADVERVYLLSGAYRDGQRDDVVDLMINLNDVAVIELALKQIPDCRLIIIDPIGSFLGSRTDSHRDNEVRAVLAPICKLAEKYGPAVLAIAHRRKSAATHADDVVIGSRGFTGLARSVWHLTQDPEDDTRKLLLPGKNNLAPPTSGLAYSITSEPGLPGIIAWEADAVEMTASEAMARERDTDGKQSATDEAEAYLKDQLGFGPIKTSDLKQQAKKDGFSPRTIERAAKNIGVVKGRNGFNGPWTWRLPELATESPE